MSSERPTASSFRDVALQVAGELCGLKAGVPFTLENLIPSVLAVTGEDITKYGVQESSGRPWLHLWISWTVSRNLRDAGLVAPVSRGVWTLTEKGVQALSPEVAPQEAFLEQTAGPDPYILGLMSTTTKCFGYYDLNLPVCQTCPLSETCLLHRVIRMEENLADLLLHEVKCQFQQQHPGRPGTHADPVVEDILRELNGNQETEGIVVPAPEGSVCYVCRKSLETGTMANHVLGHGLRHPACKST